PELFSGSVKLADGLLYPVWRLVVIASGLLVAVLLYVVVAHTRIGMLVRAGANNAAMVSALGVNIRRLFMIVFGFGAMLAGFAGIMIAPILMPAKPASIAPKPNTIMNKRRIDRKSKRL